MSLEPKRKKFLACFLEVSATEGWNEKALELANEKAKFEPHYYELLFPQALEGVLKYYLQQIDNRFEAAVKKLKLDDMRIREKIFTLVKTRMELYTPHKASHQKLTFYLSCHPLLTQKILWQTSSDIWRYGGDSSTDFNYYTKRMLLGGIYSATLLFFLKDDSEGHEKSWDFLRNRIENVMQFEKMKGKVKEVLGGL